MLSHLYFEFFFCLQVTVNGEHYVVKGDYDLAAPILETEVSGQPYRLQILGKNIGHIRLQFEGTPVSYLNFSLHAISIIIILALMYITELFVYR